jgi:hypothetical protein
MAIVELKDSQRISVFHDLVPLSKERLGLARSAQAGEGKPGRQSAPNAHWSVIHNTSVAMINRVPVITIMALSELLERPSYDSLVHVRRYPMIP